MTCSRKSSISSLSNVPLHAVTDVHGRTFGVWTLLTCTLCFLCALNLENRPLYLATFLSFIYAIGHFLTEYLIYHTMAAANLSTVGFFAGTKFAFWMYLYIHFVFEKLVPQSLAISFYYHTRYSLIYYLVFFSKYLFDLAFGAAVMFSCAVL